MSNAEKAIPEIEVQIAGSPMKLVMSTWAFCKLEEVTGKSCLDGATFTKPDARTLSVLIWAALQTHHPEAELEWVRKNLSVPQLLALFPTIMEAMNRATPPSKDEKKSDAA
jgi:hypothetical protein